MRIEVTLLQMLVVQALKEKPLTKQEIGKRLDKSSKGQTAQAIRYLVDDGKILFDDDTYSLIDGAEYITAPRIKKLLDGDDPEYLVPKIEIFEPDQLTVFEVYKLRAQGLTRSRIAETLNMTKAQVLWTLYKIDQGTFDSSAEEALFVDDVQLKVWKGIGKRWRSIHDLERRLNMAYPVICQIVQELAEINAASIWKQRGIMQFERLDAKLICDRKRGA